ncbi:MAG: hypothetical protein JSU86_08235 [Phycisphaerales bacterium]|nr:MAG: hypothetical protein JSU86_08235 [Phycisphaerales bacterium]
MTDFDDDQPLTSDEQLLSDLQFQLDEAFHRDPSIAAMNHIFRRLRTGTPKIDKELRNYIGLLYTFARLRASRSKVKPPV